MAVPAEPNAEALANLTNSGPRTRKAASTGPTSSSSRTTISSLTATTPFLSLVVSISLFCSLWFIPLVYFLSILAFPLLVLKRVGFFLVSFCFHQVMLV